MTMMTKQIIHDYSDIGLEYDVSYVDTKILNVPSYSPIYVLTEDNKPFDVALMALDAIDRSNSYLVDCKVPEIVDDIRVWFSHPEDDNEILTRNFWTDVEDILYSEQETDAYEAQEWQRELASMRSAYEREVINELKAVL